MLKLLAQWISSGFGSGYAAVAPGTAGSIAAFIFWWLLFRLGILGQPYGILALATATTCVGTVAVAYSLQSSAKNSDPQWIVIDEWAGLFVALVGIAPADFTPALLALVVFRVLDATKYGPVAWAEQLPGAFGVMADDLVAGALTAGIIALLRVTGFI